MKRNNHLVVIGFLLALTGAVLPFLIILGVLPSTFFLNFLSFSSSMVGIFLGVIWAAMYVGEKRRKSEDDFYER
jgi:cytosine/uracil/thiamine/allantoin permease